MSDSSEEENTLSNDQWVVVNDKEEEPQTLEPAKNKPEEPAADTDSDEFSVISESEAGHESSTSTDGPWTQFYLDCSQEPVEELNQHDLGTVETDVDSIPSEQEEVIHEDVQTLSGTVVPQRVDNSDKSIATRISYFVVSYWTNKYFLITLLIATIPMFISHLSIFNDFDDDFILEQKYKNFNAKYDIDVNKINPIQYCQQLHKSDGLFMEVNVKKCLIKTVQNKYKNKRNENSKKEIEKLLAVWEKIVEKRNNDTGTNCAENKKAIKAKEDYLKKKEQFLVEKEYELLKTELKYIRKKDDNRNDDKISEKKKYKKYKDERKYEKHDNFKVKNDSIKAEESKTKYKEKNDKVKYDKKTKKFEEKITKENRNYKNKYNKKDSDEKMDGSWHVKLHEARQNLRKKGQDSICYKWKGLKPNWYLSLMKNRQYVRDKVKHIPRCI